MSDRHGRINAAGDSAELPPPADFLTAGGPAAAPPDHFRPEQWDAEMVDRQELGDEDPVETDRGRQESDARAAVFLSDLHAADGTAAGDDFLESHLEPDDAVGGLYTGFFPPGKSRAGMLIRCLTFALDRLAERAPGVRPDLVLHGDVINGLELKGRGGTYVSPRHEPLFRAMANFRRRGDVFWLRGNHDYAVPSGPWRRGEFYVNPALQLLAEHGDRWDESNWPPGPGNEGSKLAIEAGSAFEVHAGVLRDGSFKYLFSGVDNLRPWDDDALKGFLDRRSKYSDAALLAAVLARFTDIGAADDSDAFKGALRRRKTKAYRDWLMIQGHTHVPALVPGVYHNTGTWISTLAAPGGKERLIDAFPFVLVYLDRGGERVEEYYLATRPAPGAEPRVALQSPESVNELRRSFGYKDAPSP